MYVKKGIKVDKDKVDTVDEVETTGIFVLIIVVATESKSLKYRPKERHHEEGKKKILVICAELMDTRHIIVIPQNIFYSIPIISKVKRKNGENEFHQQ